MDFTEKTVEQRCVYDGRIIRVRSDRIELPGGKPALREVVEHSGGVCVLARTPGDELLFVRQYRYPAERELLELPAGKLSPGEDPAHCGKRELLEETGATAGVFELLGCIYPSPGYSAERIWLYYADDLSFGEACPDEDEFLERLTLPRSRVGEMVASGEITDGKTIAALYLFDQKYPNPQ